MRSTFAFALLGAVSTQFIFASYQIIGSLVLSGGLNPIALALWREVGASCVFLFAACIHLPQSGWPQREHYCRFVFCGVSMFGNVFLNLFALTLTSAASAAVMQPTIPLFAAFIAAVLGYEKMTAIKVGGMVLGCLGSVVMTVSAQLDSGHRIRVDVGCIVLIIQCVCGANYVVQQVPLVRFGYSPLIVAGVSYFVATLFTLALAIVYFVSLSSDELATLKWWDPSLGFLMTVAFLILFVTVFNYVVMAWATGKLGASLVTLATILQGIFVASFQWFLFSKTVSVMAGIGALVIAVGLCMVVEDRRRADAAEAADGMYGFERLPRSGESVETSEQ